MIRAWIGPVVLGLVLALAGYALTLGRAPHMLMAAAMHRLDRAGGGVNRMAATPLATDRSRAIVRPSPDLAYSSCPFDLSAGPLAIDVPPVPASYWSLSVFDADTNVAFVRNNVESGNAPIRVTLATPQQAVAPGREVVRVPSARGIALLRILVDDRLRFPLIDLARTGASCRTVAAG